MGAIFNTSRTIFIGDVHGLLAPLEALLEKLAPRTGDRLIFLGDLVDKGPDPVGVVRLVAALQARTDITTHLLRGNHEDQHIRYKRNLIERPKVARQMAERKPPLSEFYDAADDLIWATLEDALPFWRCHEQNLLAVHGGIPGDMWNFPHHWDEVQHLTRHDQRMVEKIWRTRYISKETGVFLASGQQAPDDPFWAEVYDGRFGHVVFGHEVFMDGPAFFPHATGIDTGAVHGGALSALIWRENEPANLVSVPGEKHSRNLKDDA